MNKLQTALKTIAPFFLGILLLSSCEKDDNPTPATSNTITDVIVADPNFSTLESAVLIADLETTLSGPGPFTVFAPDNSAFTASGITNDVLNSLTSTEV